MLTFLRNKIRHNTRFKRTARKMIGIIIVIKQCLREIRELIFDVHSSYSDKNFLEYEIRRKAHIVEKFNKLLTKEPKAAYANVHFVATELQQLLQQWTNAKYEETGSITWARKIHAEYQQYLTSEFECPLSGKQWIQKKYSNLISLLKERRSIRRWNDSPITRDEILRLVDAARWAPSSCNRQTWRFLIISDRGLIEKVAPTVRGGAYFFKNAPTLIVVLNDVRPYDLPAEKYVLYQDAAAAIQNMLLMAHEMGLGTCWGAYTSDSGIIINESKLRKELRIPSYYKISGIIAIGRPAGQVCAVPRRSIDDIVSFNTFEDHRSL